MLSNSNVHSLFKIFGAVTNSNGVLSGNIAGICGLGFKALAETQAYVIFFLSIMLFSLTCSKF